MFEQVEELKRNFTDKYVMVDGAAPELARFRDTVGQVKTVNMSGRALVQFGDYHANTGWYDIDTEFLRIVEKPPELKQPAEKKHAAPAKKAAGTPPVEPGDRKLSPLEMARQQGASKSSGAPAAPTGKSSTGKSSTADILAKARGGAAPAPKEEAAKPAGKQSTADILAAARGKGAAPAAKPAEAKVPAPKPAPVAPPAPVVPVEPEPVAPAAEAGGAKGGGGAKVDKTTMTIDQMIAWCREHDAS